MTEHVYDNFHFAAVSLTDPWLTEGQDKPAYDLCLRRTIRLLLWKMTASFLARCLMIA